MNSHGQRHHRAKYPDDLVELARTMLDSGWPRGTVAWMLGVKYDTVRDWVEFRTRVRG